ncbi:rhodanese-like domain-containing protein [Desulfolithobacter dissulfuricans]|nr:rhodanese-like domain-containing protein [Desulfolithobacter dissulfuricans]
MSTKSAGLAKKLGYTNIRVLLAGEPGWAKAGYPTYAGREFISKGNIVLIDLRDADKDRTGRIPRSVSIPASSLKDMMSEIPLKAPVVLYSDREKEAARAWRLLRQEGFKKVSLVPGGIEGWVNSGGTLEQGPVVTEIRWQRKPGKGEVSLARFEKAVAGQLRNVAILDVRTREEAAEGKFAKAIHIPLDELSSRLGELPKDKEIFVHCTTGARADMAAQELKKHGYKASFLVAEVECEGTECDIEE